MKPLLSLSSPAELMEVLRLPRQSLPLLAVVSLTRCSYRSLPLTSGSLPRCGLSCTSRSSDRAFGPIKRVPRAIARACDCSEGQAERASASDCVAKGRQPAGKRNKVKWEDKSNGELNEIQEDVGSLQWELKTKLELSWWIGLNRPSYLSTEARTFEMFIARWFASPLLSVPRHGENQHIRYLITLMLTVLYVALMLRKFINSLGIKHIVHFPCSPNW